MQFNLFRDKNEEKESQEKEQEKESRKPRPGTSASIPVPGAHRPRPQTYGPDSSTEDNKPGNRPHTRVPIPDPQPVERPLEAEPKAEEPDSENQPQPEPPAPEPAEEAPEHVEPPVAEEPPATEQDQSTASPESVSTEEPGQDAPAPEETPAKCTESEPQPVSTELISLKESVDEMNERLSKALLTQDIIDALVRAIDKSTGETRDDAVRGILKDIAHMIEAYLKMVADMRKDYADNEQSLQIIDEFESFTIRMENVLEKRDVSTFIGDAYDKKCMKVVKVVETDDPSKDQTIVSTFSRGYMVGNLVLLPQSVALYKFRKQPTDENTE